MWSADLLKGFMKGSLKIELADKGLHQRAAGRAGGRFPVGAAREREEALLGEILLEHVEAVGHQRERAVALLQLLEERHRQRRVAHRDGRERKGDGGPRGILRRRADLDERLRRVGASGDGQGGESRCRAAQQFLKAFVFLGELQRIDEIADVRLAVDAEKANRGRYRRLRLPRRGPLNRRERFERALVADLSERERRIILQRALELCNGGHRVDGVLRLVVAQRFDDGAPKEVLAAGHFALGRLPYARVVAERGERSNQRRPYELRRLLLERGDELGHQRFVGI